MQTHRNIEVLIVDDGSSDRTAEIAQAWTERDPRFRLVRKVNGGVASARNLGIEKARGRLVAPCDADDLWAPKKLEHQLDTWRKSGPKVGLVYSWSVEIDADDLVQAFGTKLHDEGHVFRRMCQGNLIGNGSAAILWRDAALQCGGYDSALRARGAQGCEDLKLYLQISKHYTFGVSKFYDVAYRHTDNNMSSDLHRMLRSYDIVMSELSEQYPDSSRDITYGRLCIIDWLRLRAVTLRRPKDFLFMQRELSRQNLLFSMKSLYWSFIRPPLKAIKQKAKRFIRRGTHAAIDYKHGTLKFMGSSESDALWQTGVAPSLTLSERR